jgi:hypothetical protein
VLALSAVFRAAIGEHSQQWDLVLLEEGQHTVIEQIRRHQRCACSRLSSPFHS